MYVSGRLWMYMYAENQDATCKKFREKGLGPLGQKLAAPCSLYIADLQVLQVLLGKWRKAKWLSAHRSPAPMFARRFLTATLPSLLGARQPWHLLETQWRRRRQTQLLTKEQKITKRIDLKEPKSTDINKKCNKVEEVWRRKQTDTWHTVDGASHRNGEVMIKLGQDHNIQIGWSTVNFRGCEPPAKANGSQTLLQSSGIVGDYEHVGGQGFEPHTFFEYVWDHLGNHHRIDIASSVCCGCRGLHQCALWNVKSSAFAVRTYLQICYSSGQLSQNKPVQTSSNFKVSCTAAQPYKLLHRWHRIQREPSKQINRTPSNSFKHILKKPCLLQESEIRLAFRFHLFLIQYFFMPSAIPLREPALVSFLYTYFSDSNASF